MNGTPALTEVFVVTEKKTKLVKCPQCGGVHMPMQHTPRKKNDPTGKPIRGHKAAEDDPFKDSPMAEHFVSPKGEYFLTKIGTGYKAQFISRSGEYEDLGFTPSRAQTIDVVLAHHDRQMAGI
jgi:hypothetical protein